MGKLFKEEKIKIIDSWLSKFPCKCYFNSSFICIHEFITSREFYDLIERKHKEYKRG